MVKYIFKRIGLSVIILLGVSIIIYFLVRLMPTDYLETKFSAQIREGTITQEQLDDFRKRYGLYMPDAYLDVVFEGSDLAETEFRADTKVSKHEDYENELYDDKEFYVGTYTGINNENIVLTLSEDDNGNFIYKLTDKSNSEKTVELKSGTFNAYEGQLMLNEGAKTFEGKVTYSAASIWDKAGAVFSGYLAWLGNMLRGDLGESFIYQKPVGTVIAENMWISFLISFVALILQFVIAIPMGITSATHQYSIRDYSVTVITMIGISLPSFFFAALLIKIFSSWLGWFPTSGLVSGTSASVGLAQGLDMLWHLVLPMTVLVVLSIGGLMRYTRTNMLEVLNSDYIRTARSKGLSEKKVIYVHAFRNTMIPLMTLLAGILPSLFGGAMITEEVFSIDGIGRLAYKALQQGDVPFIMGYNMFLAVLTVIGTLFSDIMYAVVDPRVKLSK